MTPEPKHIREVLHTYLENLARPRTFGRMESEKIGIGVITCNRQGFFERCIRSLPTGHTTVVINDGKPYAEEAYPPWVTKVTQHEYNKGVGPAKNEAMKFLYEHKCDHIFLLEDDIEIVDPSVFDLYIETAKRSGIYHLNYGGHGGGNRDKDGNVVVRKTVETNGTKVDLYRNILGAFSYYFKGIVKHVGYMDEKFHNAWEHVDHTQQCIAKGLHPPFWWFADAHRSYDYIRDIKANHEGSEIRKDQRNWMENLQRGAEYYKSKWGWAPTETVDTGEEYAVNQVKLIAERYARIPAV